MRGFIIVLVIAVIGAGAWFVFFRHKDLQQTPVPKGIIFSNHSAQFNQSVSLAMENYYSLTDAFVNWDSLAVDKEAVSLTTKLDSMDVSELKRDSTGVFENARNFVNNVKHDLKNIQQAASLINKRHGLDALSKDFFNLMHSLQYSQSKLYLQECPMAFNDEDTGVWLSKSPEIRNPYMGLHHPRYGQGMIGCGETKDTLNFVQAK